MARTFDGKKIESREEARVEPATLCESPLFAECDAHNPLDFDLACVRELSKRGTKE